MVQEDIAIQTSRDNRRANRRRPHGPARLAAASRSIRFPPASKAVLPAARLWHARRALWDLERQRHLVSDESAGGGIVSLRWRRRRPARSGAFNLQRFLLAVPLHLLISLMVGLLYGAMLPMLPRHPILLGGFAGPLLWSGLIYGILAFINPVMNQHIDWLWFVLSQFGFGIVAGIVVAVQERIPTRQTLTADPSDGYRSSGPCSEHAGGSNAMNYAAVGHRSDARCFHRAERRAAATRRKHRSFALARSPISVCSSVRTARDATEQTDRGH